MRNFVYNIIIYLRRCRNVRHKQRTLVGGGGEMSNAGENQLLWASELARARHGPRRRNRSRIGRQAPAAALFPALPPPKSRPRGTTLARTRTDTPVRVIKHTGGGVRRTAYSVPHYRRIRSVAP